MMFSTELLRLVRTEITAAEARASAYADAAAACLKSGADSITAEQSLFRELDSLMLLRAKEQAMRLMELNSQHALAA